MENMMIHVELLSKHISGNETKSVNAIGSHRVSSHQEEVAYASFDEDIIYFTNQGMGSRMG